MSAANTVLDKKVLMDIGSNFLEDKTIRSSYSDNETQQFLRWLRDLINSFSHMTPDGYSFIKNLISSSSSRQSEIVRFVAGYKFVALKSFLRYVEDTINPQLKTIVENDIVSGENPIKNYAKVMIKNFDDEKEMDAAIDLFRASFVNVANIISEKSSGPNPYLVLAIDPSKFNQFGILEKELSLLRDYVESGCAVSVEGLKDSISKLVKNKFLPFARLELDEIIDYVEDILIKYMNLDITVLEGGPGDITFVFPEETPEAVLKAFCNSIKNSVCFCRYVEEETRVVRFFIEYDDDTDYDKLFMEVYKS